MTDDKEASRIERLRKIDPDYGKVASKEVKFKFEKQAPKIQKKNPKFFGQKEQAEQEYSKDEYFFSEKF